MHHKRGRGNEIFAPAHAMIPRGALFGSCEVKKKSERDRLEKDCREEVRKSQVQFPEYVGQVITKIMQININYCGLSLLKTFDITQEENSSTLKTDHLLITIKAKDQDLLSVFIKQPKVIPNMYFSQ